MAISTIADPMTANSTTAPSGAGQITLLAESGGTDSNLGSTPGATTIISGGTTTTESFPCNVCCYSFEWLPFFFGSSGICPGDIPNTVPVNLTATWNFTPAAGITLSDYCLGSSGSFGLIADSTIFAFSEKLLRLTSPASCPVISSPTTRVSSATTPVCITVDSSMQITLSTVFSPIYICACNSAAGLAFYDRVHGTARMDRTSYSCNPFSITFKNKPNTVLLGDFFGTTVSDNFTLTLTE